LTHTQVNKRRSYFKRKSLVESGVNNIGGIMKAFSNEVVDRKMLSEVIKRSIVMSAKYTIGSKFNNSNSNDKHKIVFEVTLRENIM
jgi:hypothetical protein